MPALFLVMLIKKDCSILGSGILLLVSDVIGRIIGSPGETEVGIITAVFGAPVFIFAIRKGRVKSL